LGGKSDKDSAAGRSMLKRVVPFTRKAAAFFMNSPFRRVARAFGFRAKVTEGAYIDLVNKTNEETFRSTPFEERALFLPHCMRHKKCPATLGKHGYTCKECGKCAIKKLKREAEKLGYSVFVVPGGSVVWNIIKDFKPKAVLGVACSKELLMAIEVTEANGLPTQSVMLLRDGCVNTLVDEDAVIERLKMSDV